jgi:hypothetical protein
MGGLGTIGYGKSDHVLRSGAAVLEQAPDRSIALLP